MAAEPRRGVRDWIRVALAVLALLVAPLLLLLAVLIAVGAGAGGGMVAGVAAALFALGGAGLWAFGGAVLIGYWWPRTEPQSPDHRRPAPARQSRWQRSSMGDTARWRNLAASAVPDSGRGLGTTG